MDGRMNDEYMKWKEWRDEEKSGQGNEKENAPVFSRLQTPPSEKVEDEDQANLLN